MTTYGHPQSHSLRKPTVEHMQHSSGHVSLFILLFLLAGFLCISTSCGIDEWDGPTLTQPRAQLTAEQLQKDSHLDLLDMSFFARPGWATEATHRFSGSLTFEETSLLFPKQRESYEGEDIFPHFTVDFVVANGVLIPLQKGLIETRHQSKSLWDVIVGAGKVWQEEDDGGWSRASFPISLTDRYIGQVRNCVATFVYTQTQVSRVYIQCSQETADIDDGQVGNIRANVKATYTAKTYPNKEQIVATYQTTLANRLPVRPLHDMDKKGEVAEHFEKTIRTNAPTSLGALLIDGVIYLHPPKTRHGHYPYPAEMRHGLYSVTKSMVGSLALLYFAQRYGEQIFDALITDYVPTLAKHPGWQGVTFSHALNMVTGTEGSERSEHLYKLLILAQTAEEGIKNIATLGNTPSSPGEQFNYASTNSFVLSYALQRYVQKKEGEAVHYWDLLHKHVLVPIGAEHFDVLRTQEAQGQKGLPMFAYGARPTIDEAAKIAQLFIREGAHNDRQLLHKEKTREALGRGEWKGHSTQNDFRGTMYHHAFWSKTLSTESCDIHVSYMLGHGSNYTLFLPGNTVIFRFLDEHDLDFTALVRSVMKLRPACS